MQKSILITGCSTGIGLYAAIELQKKGYRVFASARKADDVKKLEQMGLESVALDVNSSESIQAALNLILNKTNGTLYALFNNAGYGLTGAIEHLSREAIRTQFETNVLGPMELIATVIPIMKKQGFGRIIQNTSILGVITLPYYGAYSASKFALEAISRTLRQELRGTQVYASSLILGPTLSEFRKNALAIHQYYINDDPIQYTPLKKYFMAPSLFLMATPKHVVKKLSHALESPHPKLHYYVGIPANFLALLRRILCDCALDWVTQLLSRVQK